jgi:hypothetical protein
MVLAMIEQPQMIVACPYEDCDGQPSQGNDYAKMLKLAEAGELRFFCGKCRRFWTPSLEEQQTIAENIRDRAN